MADRKEPRGWYVEDRIAEIKYVLDRLEWEMMGAFFIGNRAAEMEALAERLQRLAKEDKGHGQGLRAREFKDAA
jgi:hypothetical protein